MNHSMHRFYVAWLLLVARTLVAAGLDAALFDYYPGKYLSWERYEALSNEMWSAWRKQEGAEAAMAKLDRAVEPEALLALLTILNDDKHRVLYGSYSAPHSKHEHEIKTADGLLGFRVIRQTERRVGDSLRLISSIETYDFDEKAERFAPRHAPDSVRVRVEISPFMGKGKQKSARGFAGYSWITEEKGFRYEPYLSDERVKADPDHLHLGIRFPGVTPCAFSAHCHTCHHATRRNFFTTQELALPATELPGAREFLESLKPGAAKRVLAQLAAPEKTFPAGALRKAAEARWKSLSELKK